MKKNYVKPEVKLFAIGADERIASDCDFHIHDQGLEPSDCTWQGVDNCVIEFSYAS